MLCRRTLFILTPGLSPYRTPIFLGLQKEFDVTIVHGANETNRPEWKNLEEELVGQGVRVVEASGKMVQLGPEKFLHLEVGFLTILTRFRPDAVISVEMGFRSLCALAYGKLFGRPVWVWWGGTPHSERRLGPLKRVIRALITRCRIGWISYGVVATKYLETWPIRKESIVQIQNAVDEHLFSPEGDRVQYDGHHPVILVVGQLVDRKGLFQLLDSIGRVVRDQPNFSVKLIGSGHLRSQLEQIVSEKGITNVEFLGGVSPKSMPAYYRGADVLLFPTLEDIWGLVVNEALLCGVPVIASRYAGCAEELLEQVDTFDPLDPNDFDKAIIRAIDRRVSQPDRSKIWPIQRVITAISRDIERATQLVSR